TSQKDQVPASSSNDPVIVTINNQPITEKQFDSELTGRDKGALIKAKSELYEAKKDTLDAYVFQKLATEEAKKKKLSLEDYLKKEVDSKIKPVKDKDIQEFYNKVKSQYEKGGKSPPPLND